MASVKATGAEFGGDVKRRNVPVLEVPGTEGGKQTILVPEVDDKKQKKPVCSLYKAISSSHVD